MEDYLNKRIKELKEEIISSDKKADTISRERLNHQVKSIELTGRRQELEAALRHYKLHNTPNIQLIALQHIEVDGLLRYLKYVEDGGLRYVYTNNLAVDAIEYYVLVQHITFKGTEEEYRTFKTNNS